MAVQVWLVEVHHTEQGFLIKFIYDYIDLRSIHYFANIFYILSCPRC